MEFVRGRIFRDISLPDVHPDQRSAIYDAMNEALATLHCALSHCTPPRPLTGPAPQRWTCMRWA